MEIEVPCDGAWDPIANIKSRLHAGGDSFHVGETTMKEYPSPRVVIVKQNFVFVAVKRLMRTTAKLIGNQCPSTGTGLSRYCQPIDRNRPIKNCPKCNIKIEKNGGCNHMCCKCGCHFCWICLEADTDYSHFCGRERRHGDEMVDEIARRRQAMRAIIDEPVNLDYIVNALAGRE